MPFANPQIAILSDIGYLLASCLLAFSIKTLNS